MGIGLKLIITVMCTSISTDFVNPFYNNKWVCLYGFSKKASYYDDVYEKVGAHYDSILKQKSK
jgi:hypothetical protein